MSDPRTSVFQETIIHVEDPSAITVGDRLHRHPGCRVTIGSDFKLFLNGAVEDELRSLLNDRHANRAADDDLGLRQLRAADFRGLGLRSVDLGPLRLVPVDGPVDSRQLRVVGADDGQTPGTA